MPVIFDICDNYDYKTNSIGFLEKKKVIHTGHGVFSTPYLIRYAAAAISSKRRIRGVFGSHHSSYKSSSLISNADKL